MGKMLTALLIVFLIEASISIFMVGEPAPGEETEEKTSFFEWLFNPQDWGVSDILGEIDSTIFLIGGAVAITVGTLWMKSEFLVYAGVASVFLSFGATLYRLWQETAKISFFGGEAVGQIMATTLLGCVFIYFLISVMDYARGKD